MKWSRTSGSRHSHHWSRWLHTAVSVSLNRSDRTKPVSLDGFDVNIGWLFTLPAEWLSRRTSGGDNLPSGSPNNATWSSNGNLQKIDRSSLVVIDDDASPSDQT